MKLKPFEKLPSIVELVVKELMFALAILVESCLSVRGTSDEVHVGGGATVDFGEEIKRCKSLAPSGSTVETRESSGVVFVLPFGFEVAVLVAIFLIGEVVFFFRSSVVDRGHSTLLKILAFMLLTSSVKRVSPLLLPSGV